MPNLGRYTNICFTKPNQTFVPVMSGVMHQSL